MEVFWSLGRSLVMAVPENIMLSERSLTQKIIAFDYTCLKCPE